MTPEIAEYHRAMLLAGFDDRFQRYFDNALETEEPLSDVILSLCTCISDRNQVLSILREYTLEHPFDDNAVRDLIVEDVRSRYLTGEMDRAQVVSVLYDIVTRLDKFWDDGWNFFVVPSYALELREEDLISEDVFYACFDAWFHDGQRLDPWELHRQNSSREPKPKWYQKLFKK